MEVPILMGRFWSFQKTYLSHHKIINAQIKGIYLEESLVHQYKYKWSASSYATLVILVYHHFKKPNFKQIQVNHVRYVK